MGDQTYLSYIMVCIARIENYSLGSRDHFLSSTMIQDAVIRNLQTLGESTRRVSERLKASHPEINWRGIAGFRNVLVHDFMRLDLDVIWNVVEKDVPELRMQTAAILERLGDSP